MVSTTSIDSAGDILAILNRYEDGKLSEWWKGKVRDGPVGYFPANYVEMLEKKVHLDVPK